jgi:ubiquinone biosynthesis protein COQ4
MAALRLLITNRQAPLSSYVAIAPRNRSSAASCLSNHVHRLTTSSFYGSPLPPPTRYSVDSSRSSSARYNNHHSDQLQQREQQHYIPPLTPLQRLGTLLHSSFTALNDPTRADAVAAVGEVTGSFALSKILVAMEKDEVGRRILVERPLVDDRVATRALELLEQHKSLKKEGTGTTKGGEHHNQRIQQQPNNNNITFGAAYATFLQRHDFHPNERSKIRFLSDPNLSYVMTRYRQNHDYWHVLTGLPPTVLGELALKWLELIQTGLPLAALSATGGAMGVTSNMLSSKEREVLWEVYFPWAMRVGNGMRENALMCTYYEEELETDLGVLRERMGIEEAPRVEL